jgi:hypothetical protein
MGYDFVTRCSHSSRTLSGADTHGLAAGTRETEIRFQPAGRPNRAQFLLPRGCHVAATRSEIGEEQEGPTRERAPRKPAWSLQVREMVEHLGLRGAGSNPFSRSNDTLSPDAHAPGRSCFRIVVRRMNMARGWGEHVTELTSQVPEHARARARRLREASPPTERNGHGVRIP